MALDGIPTKATLKNKNIHIQMKCNFCPNNYEDLNHIFLKCPNTLKHLHKINLKTANVICHLSNPDRKMIDVLRELNKKLLKKDLQELFVIWWCLWDQRNTDIFETNKQKKINNVIEYTKYQMKIWKESKAFNSDNSPSKDPSQSKKQTRRKRTNIKWQLQ